MSEPKLATYADVLALPEGVRAEIHAGTVVKSPGPLPKHSKARRALGSFIGGPYDDDDGYGGQGGWWIFVEVDVQLGAHEVVRPDLAGWRRARLSDPGERRPIDVVPDWVCEISSPSTAAHDRVYKRDLYARTGVPHYWILDVEAKVLEAFELRAGSWVLIATHDALASQVRIAPFGEVALDVGRLFLPEASAPQR